MDRNITIPAGSSVTIRIESNTVGITEAKTTAPAVIERKATGLTPQYRVSYTSEAGKTAIYGVFWEGPSRDDKSVKRVGLKPMLKAGYRMVKSNRYSSMSRGFFVTADKCQPLS